MCFLVYHMSAWELQMVLSHHVGAGNQTRVYESQLLGHPGKACAGCPHSDRESFHPQLSWGPRAYPLHKACWLWWLGLSTPKVSTAVVKHPDQSKLRKKRVYFSLQVTAHHPWEPRQELKQVLAQPALLCNPGPLVQGRPHPVAWARPHQSVTKKMPSPIDLLIGQSFFSFFLLSLKKNNKQGLIM